MKKLIITNIIIQLAVSVPAAIILLLFTKMPLIEILQALLLFNAMMLSRFIPNHSIIDYKGSWYGWKDGMMK